jgi:hypothetical protein
MWFKADDDFIDEIVRQGLVDTYVGLMRDLEKVELKQINRSEEDIMLWKRVAYAIEILGEWYFSDFEDDVKKREKKK